MPLKLLALTSFLFLGLLVSTAGLLKGQTSDSQKSALTNQDVVDLLKAGLTSEIVIAKIKSSVCAFDTSPAALKDLKYANVPDSVILAIIQAPQGQGPTQEKSIAQEKSSARPTVEQVLDKYVEALGGETNIRKFTSTYMSGTFEHQGKTGTFQRYSKAPNKILTIRTISGFTPASDGFDGSVPWSDSTPDNTRQMTVQEIAVAKRDADFYQTIRLRELYPKMTLLVGANVGGRPVYLIQADPGDGSFRKMYFDTDTGLLLRNDLEYDASQGRAIITWYFEDYREVDGVKMAFTRHSTNPDGGFVMKIAEVRHDLFIDDSRFAKPALAVQVSSSLPSNTVKAVAYRVVPQQRTTYYQSGTNSSSTSCYGQGQFYSFGNFGNMNVSMDCNTSYTTPTQIPITWRFADVYVVVEGSNQLYLIGCRANWRWSNCMPLVVGDAFSSDVAGGTMTVTALKNGKKEIHAKYNILEVKPKS